MSEPVVHFILRFTPMGIPVPACHAPGGTDSSVAQHQVTCRNCRRTKAWREAAGRK